MNEQNEQPSTYEVSETEFPIAAEVKEQEAQLKERALIRIPVVQQLAVAVGLLLLVFGTTYLSDITRLFTGNNVADEDTHESVEEDRQETENPFETISIRGTSAYVWDVKNQRALFNKNADEQLPLASIAKLMTALVAYELLGSDASVSVTTEAVGQNGDSGLASGEQFSSRNLLDLILVTSSNDGTYALAAAAGQSTGQEQHELQTFVDAMNIRADELGLSRTYFRNTTGLDISETESGTYGSARDVAFLMEYLVTIYPEVLELTRDSYMLIPNEDGATHQAENTNRIVSEIPGLIASKTGFTTLAGGNLVVAFDVGLNHPVIAVVLGSTYQGRFNDIRQLVAATGEVIHNQ